MTIIALVLLLALGLALHAIARLRREIKSLQAANALLEKALAGSEHLIADWRRVATGGAFAELIESLNFDRPERKT